MALQARTEFAAAINQIASEKGVDTDVILDAIKQAALAAYRKDLSYRNEAIPDDFEELTAKLNSQSGEIGIYRGEENITPPGFARIAAQTAKQVIAQKLHEAEKGAIFEEYEQRVGSVVSGAIQRQEGNTYFVDLGRAEGLMPPPEQVRGEFYSQNQRMKFYIKEIRESGRGPEVIVSRSDPGLVKGLFATEVPEIQAGSVEIKEIAREAGGRSKVAVISNQDGVDPVGSLVGQKGVRVQAVINELGDEKIDIVLYSDDPAKFIGAALSPAKEAIIELNQEERVAKVKVSDNQLSLAIGKGGQNVRLAAKLSGWKIDIEGTGEPGFNPFEPRESSDDRRQNSDRSDRSDKPEKKEKSSSTKASPFAKASEDKSTDEEGTKEKEQDLSAAAQDTGAAASDDAVGAGVADDDQVAKDKKAAEIVEDVEKDIDDATKEESADGKTEPEPSAEEQSEAAADAEEDMEEDEKSASVETTADKSDEVGTAPSKDFEEVEEEKIEKESASAEVTADKDAKEADAEDSK